MAYAVTDSKEYQLQAEAEIYNNEPTNDGTKKKERKCWHKWNSYCKKNLTELTVTHVLRKEMGEATGFFKK